MNDKSYRKIKDGEIIERLGWVLEDILRLQETSNHVNIGIINIANLNSMKTHIARIKAELEKRGCEQS